ncbi:MAG: dephospho-CoA kinase [Deltaproteobacteria bacterium]|nr:dephospho-CoA kinase [Deltaproteobacteria bacterium]
MVAGLTGGIASGKTLVSGELKRLGAHLIDADVIARELVEPGKPAYKEIVEEFGPDVVLEDGTLNRKKLGSIVFSDNEKLQILNRITHPRIIERTRELIEEIKRADGGDALIIVDAAILIEAGIHNCVDKLIVVHVDPEVQIGRLKKRDNLSAEDAKRRIAAQLPLKEKAGYADYVIENNGTPLETLERTRALFLELKKNQKRG